jgi:hypothetical protein
MNVINKLTFAAALGMLAMLASTSVSAANAPDISGSYTCTYPMPTGGTRSETMIFKKNGDVFNVQVIALNNPLPYEYGTAIFNSDLANTFGFVYWSPKNSSLYGVELYKIKSNGSFNGVYLDPGKIVPSTEICKKSS